MRGAPCVLSKETMRDYHFAHGGIIPNDGAVVILHQCDFPLPRKLADQIKRACVGVPAVKGAIAYDYKFHDGVLTSAERS